MPEMCIHATFSISTVHVLVKFLGKHTPFSYAIVILIAIKTCG